MERGGSCCFVPFPLTSPPQLAAGKMLIGRNAWPALSQIYKRVV